MIRLEDGFGMYMYMSIKTLPLGCLELFLFFNIDLSNETPSLEKEGYSSFTVNMMFLPRDDYNKILNNENVKEEARVKKSCRVRIPGEKQKKADKEDEEFSHESSGSEREPSGHSGGLNKRFNYLKGQVKKLNSGYKHLKKNVLREIDEIKCKIKILFHTFVLEYKKKKDQPKPWTSSSEELQPQASISRYA